MVDGVYNQIGSMRALNELYRNLLSRDLSEFDALSLDVNAHATDIMKVLTNLSPDVVKELVSDFLDGNGIKFVPQGDAQKIIAHFSNREANAQTHTFSELGWIKKRFAWSGQNQRWAWHHPDYKPQNAADQGLLEL